MAKRDDGIGGGDRGGRERQAPSAPVVTAPDPVAATAPAPAAPAAKNRREQAPEGPAPPSPQPSSAPPDLPPQASATPPQATPAQRPGTQASQQQLYARAGVRVGAFDPRQRGQSEIERGVLQALAGAPQHAVGAAGQPIPASLGFNPKQFEQEQMILGALRGQ
jgi:hypothetical protein